MEQKCHIECGTVVRVLQKPVPTVEIWPVALQRTLNWSAFVLLFNSAGENHHFDKKFYLVFSLLADFYKFRWTSEVYATLTMGNRFLGMQISIVWVVFAFKTVTLMWQAAKAQDIARKCHSSTVICCWNLLYSHYDYQRISASTPDTWVVEAVYQHKNWICLCVCQRGCSCIIELKRV